MTDAKTGYGTTLKRSSNGTSGGTFTAIGQVRSITPATLTRDTKDVTHLESSGRYREFIANLRDAGEFSAELYLDADDGTYNTLITDFEDDDAQYYQIELASGSTWGYTAYLTSLTPPTLDENELTLTATFKITGAPDWTQTS